MMNLSDQQHDWDSIAGLKPRLRADVDTFQHWYRGQPWYVLQERSSTRHFRIDAPSHQIISQFDGKRTLLAVWEKVNELAGRESLSKEELVKIMARLQHANLLQWDSSVDYGVLLDRKASEKRRQLRQKLMRPLAMRFTLFDPTRLLNWLTPVLKPIFSIVTLLVLGSVLMLALALTAINWEELQAHWLSRGLDPRNLLLLLFIYPAVKALHELGHAVAIRVWGGEVHEMGIMLLVLMPIPYVDASASAAFSDKRQRIIVSAAGIMVEVFLASMALFVWLNIQPGLLRDIAFNIMLIGGVSSVLFNGNPLLRFDGYYVLADAIEIPNLATRAKRYLDYLAKHYLFNIKTAATPVLARGEQPWFIFYGVAAGLYRIGLILYIALYIASKLFVIGLVLAIWVIFGGIVYPATRYLSDIFLNPLYMHARGHASRILGAAALVIVLLIFVVPAPLHTAAEGIIRVPEEAQVRTQTEGFVALLSSDNGQPVQAGDAVIELYNQQLHTDIAVLESRLQELQARIDAEYQRNRVLAGILKDEMRAAQAELDDSLKKRKSLTVASPSAGTLIMNNAADLEGRFIKQGEVIGYVIDPAEVTAQVVIPQTAVDLVRQKTQAVEVLLASGLGRVIAGRLLHETPSASVQLPSPALGTQRGGDIEVDARDSRGTRAIVPVFQVDIAIPAVAAGHYIGSRVYVRFSHGNEPLAFRWYRNIRQLFLARFQV